MGIAYLWDLLLACGKRVPLQFLRGRVLAIDASIWITRANAVFGNTTLTIRSILSKIVALMKIGVKPIFVFDGTPPAIKRNCLELRRRRRVQFGGKQIKKIAQIELLKVLKGDSQKPKKGKLQLRRDSESEHQESEGESIVQIQLKQLPTEMDTVKTQLYTQLLCQKYRLIKQMYPHMFFKHNQEQFFNLPLNLKVEVIQETEKNLYVEQRPKKVKNETCEKSIQRQLQVIKNKTRINQLRDQIYRKLVEKIEHQVNEENNLETVVGTYQGNTFRQIRRIQKKPLNNISQIITRKREPQGERQEDQVIEEQEREIERSLPTLKEGETFLSLLKSGFGCQDLGEVQEQDQFALFNDKEDEGGEVNIAFKAPILNVETLPNSNIGTNVMKQPEIKEQKREKEEEEDEEVEQYPAFNQPFEAQLEIIGQKSNIELKQLLDLLGLPYVIAPSEAEAQCAQLQKQGLVEGVITDDSDIFAFGGKNVYRGVFQNDVKYYGEIEFKKELHFSQQQFIIFALFTGSDYTDGVKGVGLVNAMQIIKSFNTFAKLVHFREWAKEPDIFNPENEEFYKTTNQEQRKFFEFHKNFKNYWHIDQTFPNQDVIDAYISPKVETKVKKFEFGEPNVKVLEKLMRERLELSMEESERKIRELREAVKSMKTSQTRIMDYFSVNKESIGRIRSKRLQNALK